MTKDIEMDFNTNLADIKTFLMMSATFATENLVKENPIGTVTALVGLLYVFDRWRTQRIIKKREQLKLDNETSELLNKKE